MLKAKKFDLTKMGLEDNLKWLRQKAGLKQKELAAAIGVVPSQISAYEKGTGRPSYEVIIKLIEYYEIRADDLISRDLPTQGLSADEAAQTATLEKVVWETKEEVEQLVKELGDKVTKDQLADLITDLERVAPDQIKSFREKHDI
ncbi:MAG: helix-turn-helix transcriptional regulator [Bacteroidota bacterium]